MLGAIEVKVSAVNLTFLSRVTVRGHFKSKRINNYGKFKMQPFKSDHWSREQLGL